MTLVLGLLITIISFFSGLLWYLLSLILGSIETTPVIPFVFFLISHIVSALAFVLLRDRVKLKSQYLVLVLTPIPATIVSLVLGFGPFSANLLCYIFVYLFSFFALASIRNITHRISFTRKEELSVMIIRSLKILGLSIFVVAIILPFYFMIFSSITPRSVFLQNPINLAPRFSLGFQELFSGYVEVMQRFNFGRYILNSLLVSIVSVILTLIPATLGAYAVTRLQFRGRNFLSRSILLIYMFPSIVLAIPLYSVFATLGLRDNLLGLFIVYPAITIPVSLYMLRNYFATLPKDIEEAGLMDGCTRLEVIWRITLPLSLPALMAVGLYVFMIAWNEFLFAFMFLDNQAMFTLSRGIVSLNSQEVPRQFLMAGAIIITVPVMVIFFSLERFFTGGLVAGGVKG